MQAAGTLFHFDLIAPTRALGWAFNKSEPLVSVQAWQNGRLIGESPINILREDVGAAHGAHAGKSGFSLRYLPSGGEAKVEFKAKTGTGAVRALMQATVIVPDLSTLEQSLARPFLHASPFPQAVARILRAANPALFDRSLTDADEDGAADTLIAILQSNMASMVPDLVRYVRFLHDSWSHMLLVERLFPEVNALADQGSIDHLCKVNSPSQMISVVNQLYVAKEMGLNGAFAEFGCFKGFSTAMLSEPCARLGIPMLVFDSFEGLPPCEGDNIYKAGQFRGGLDEVRANVSTFGNVDNITFHKGFFSESLKAVKVPALVQIWMDVDLYSSAADMAPAFDAVHPRGAIFSHECDPRMYRDGNAIEGIPRSCGNVAPAIIDRLTVLGAKGVRGRFIAGNTGAFWRKETGIPVLSHSSLMKIVNHSR